MRPGTPGFVGDRLREAREARGLTGPTLADLLGVSRQSVSAYENSNATPGPEVADRILTVLNLPMRFFLDTGPSEDPSPIYWRSRAAATKAARERSQRRYNWLRRITQHLTEFVRFPDVQLPPALVVSEPVQIANDDIDDAARRTRSFFGLGSGAIENVTWLLENHGVIIGYAELGAPTLNSFSQMCRDGRAFAIVNAEHGSSVRYRFDLAHELGHLVLHRNLDGSHFSNTTRNALIEHQADRFAREFLMPSQAFAKNFYSTTLDGLKVVKRMWGVSMQAALMHATDLDLVNKVQAQKLWRGISMRGWRRNEPFDDVIPRENAELLRSAFDEVLRAGVTPEALLEALPYSAREIEVLCGLEPGKLGGSVDAASVFELSSASRPTPKPVVTRPDRQPAAGAEVIIFGHDRRDRS